MALLGGLVYFVIAGRKVTWLRRVVFAVGSILLGVWAVMGLHCCAKARGIPVPVLERVTYYGVLIDADDVDLYVIGWYAERSVFLMTPDSEPPGIGYASTCFGYYHRRPPDDGAAERPVQPHIGFLIWTSPEPRYEYEPPLKPMPTSLSAGSS